MKPETRLQIDLVKWMREAYPDLLFTSTQAGDRRSALAAMIMKRMGYTNGTPDLIIFRGSNIWHGLLLELKSEHGVISESQKEFARKSARAGYLYVVSNELDMAKKCVMGYLKGSL